MRRKGFTLIELIIVVIAIGILATIAVPQYLKSVERAKSAKAKNALGLISQAEKMYRAEKDAYVNVTNATINSNTGLGAFVELDEVANDPDWDYAVSGASTTAFLATATRSAGSSQTTITLDQSGSWGGTRPSDLGGAAAASSSSSSAT